MFYWTKRAACRLVSLIPINHIYKTLLLQILGSFDICIMDFPGDPYKLGLAAINFHGREGREINAIN